MNITIKLSTESNTPTYGEIANAVRRALTQTNVKDAVSVPDAPLDTKGVTVLSRPSKVVTKTYSPIRVWAQDNGYPEVANKRGRLSKTIIEAYNTAHA